MNLRAGPASDPRFGPDIGRDDAGGAAVRVEEATEELVMPHGDDPVDDVEAGVGGREVGGRRVRRHPPASSSSTPRRTGNWPKAWSTVPSGPDSRVVTLDTWITGWRPRDLATGNFPQLRGHCLANYTSDPVFRSRLAKSPEDDPAAAVMHWAQIFGNPLTWDDLPWLRSITDLPLILKGICHPDDARRAKDAGIDGIYCALLAEADLLMAVDGYPTLAYLTPESLRRIG